VTNLPLKAVQSMLAICGALSLLLENTFKWVLRSEWHDAVLAFTVDKEKIYTTGSSGLHIKVNRRMSMHVPAGRGATYANLCLIGCRLLCALQLACA
jgi:hypothetical protein